MSVCKSWIGLLAAALIATGTGPMLAEAVEENHAGAVAADKPIRIWTAVLVDAQTKRPLSGMQVETNVAIPDQAEMQKRLLVSNESGEIKIPLRKGEGTSLHIRGPGWCYTSGWAFIGEWPAGLFEDAAPPADPNEPLTYELYQGTELKGRLLLPDGNPAAGVTLIAGVHCNQTPWISQEYIDNLMRNSFSVSQWPNWDAPTTTSDDGSFSLTVPPPDVRGWIRLGTAHGGWGAIDTTMLEKSDKLHALVRFAPFEVELNGHKISRQIDESTGVLSLGDLRLSTGIILRGRVVDASGQPLPGIHLRTSSARGPYAGRATISRADGSYEFMPMNPGTLTLSPDAHFRNDKGETNSRDVRALFLPQDVTLSETSNPHELVLQALPHVELAFEWIDRRLKKGPVAYYGGFTLTGEVSRADGSKASWSGETVSVSRNDKELLVVKVPESVVGLKIGLHPDQLVTPSYCDNAVEMATGQVELHNVTWHVRRVIYGDEPPVDKH